jgi:hypothetical protein
LIGQFHAPLRNGIRDHLHDGPILVIDHNPQGAGKARIDIHSWFSAFMYHNDPDPIP